MIEAKLNLKSENEYKRLVGQIEEMNPKEHHIVIVLFGNTKPEFMHRLRKKADAYEDDFWGPQLAVIASLRNLTDCRKQTAHSPGAIQTSRFALRRAPEARYSLAHRFSGGKPGH